MDALAELLNRVAAAIPTLTVLLLTAVVKMLWGMGKRLQRIETICTGVDGDNGLVGDTGQLKKSRHALRNIAQMHQFAIAAVQDDVEEVRNFVWPDRRRPEPGRRLVDFEKHFEEA